MFAPVVSAAPPTTGSCFLDHRSTGTILFSYLLKVGHSQFMTAQTIHVPVCTGATGTNTFNLSKRHHRPKKELPCYFRLNVLSHSHQLHGPSSILASPQDWSIVCRKCVASLVKEGEERRRGGAGRGGGAGGRGGR